MDQGTVRGLQGGDICGAPMGRSTAHPWHVHERNHHTSMARPFCIHGRNRGTSVLHTLCIHGTSMAHPWAHPSHIHGTSMVHPWHIHGASILYPWHIHGTSTAHPWRIHCISTAHPWAHPPSPCCSLSLSHTGLSWQWGIAHLWPHITPMGGTREPRGSPQTPIPGQVIAVPLPAARGWARCGAGANLCSDSAQFPAMEVSSSFFSPPFSPPLSDNK